MGQDPKENTKLTGKDLGVFGNLVVMELKLTNQQSNGYRLGTDTSHQMFCLESQDCSQYLTPSFL